MLHYPAVFTGSHPPLFSPSQEGGLILQVFLGSKTTQKHLEPMVPHLSWGRGWGEGLKNHPKNPYHKIQLKLSGS